MERCLHGWFCKPASQRLPFVKIQCLSDRKCSDGSYNIYRMLQEHRSRKASDESPRAPLGRPPRRIGRFKPRLSGARLVGLGGSSRPPQKRRAGAPSTRPRRSPISGSPSSPCRTGRPARRRSSRRIPPIPAPPSPWRSGQDRTGPPERTRTALIARCATPCSTNEGCALRAWSAPR